MKWAFPFPFYLVPLPCIYGRSSNGRTTDSDSVNPGSNPGLPARFKARESGFFCVYYLISFFIVRLLSIVLPALEGGISSRNVADLQHALAVRCKLWLFM